MSKKRKKYATEIKSNQKKGFIFIGFTELGNASLKAVEIVNAELKKHYDDWEGSYLKKRSMKNHGFAGIGCEIYSFIKYGNEKKY